MRLFQSMCHAMIRLHIATEWQTKANKRTRLLACLRGRPKTNFHNLLAFFIFATSFFRSVCVSFINMRPGDFLFSQCGAHLTPLFVCLCAYPFLLFCKRHTIFRNKFSWWRVYIRMFDSIYTLHMPSDAWYIHTYIYDFGSIVWSSKTFCRFNHISCDHRNHSIRTRQIFIHYFVAFGECLSCLHVYLMASNALRFIFTGF